MALEEKDIDKIIQVYEEICGYGRDVDYVLFTSREGIIAKLNKGKTQEIRIGSKWDSDSKVYLSKDKEGKIIAEFTPNLHPNNRGGIDAEESEKAGKEFQKRIFEIF